MKKNIARYVVPLILIAFIGGCGKEEAATEYIGFDAQKYMGTWYQIARVDNRFERGVHYISANYSRRSDDRIDVVTRGYDVSRECWRETECYAVQVGATSNMKLYSSPLLGVDFKVLYVDDQYTVSLVSGRTRKSLWVFSRTPTISVEQKDHLLAVAGGLGYDVSELEFVAQK